MKWACCLLVSVLLLAASIAWTTSPFADAGRSLPSSSQSFSLPGSEAKKQNPIDGAIFGWSRVANKEDQAAERHPVDKLFLRPTEMEREVEAEERHPADKLLRRQRADMTESYILGGY